MTQWKRLVLMYSLILVVAFSAAAFTGEFTDQLDVDEYNCSLTLQPADTIGNTSAARIALEWDDKKGHIQIAVTKDLITITTIQGAKKIVVAKAPSGVTPGTSYELTIMRRGASLGLLHGDSLVLRCEIPKFGGNRAGITADAGWTSKMNDSPVQRIEPVYFTDDFMRTKDEPGAWKVQSGNWMLQSAWDNTPGGNANRFSNTVYSQNPFAWVGSNAKGGAAVCTVGEAYWEDYTFTTAVCPSLKGATGLVVNMTDADTGILLRWSPVNDQSARGNKLIACKVVNGKWGKETELASSKGGYLPGQWYRFSVVSSLEGIRVLIDGQERLLIKDTSPWRGGIGLYTEGAQGSVFDDVTVYGRTLNTDLLFETKQSQINERFQVDNNGMSDWANAKSDWLPAAGLPNHYWLRYNLFGDYSWMALMVKPTPLTTGELWMVLNGDGQNATTGYRAVMKFGGSPAKLTYSLYRDSKELASKTVPSLPPNVDYSIRFWREGTRIWLEIDDETVISATDQTPVTGLRPAYRADGCFLAARNVVVLGHNMLDYSFAEAPMDWFTEGTWMPTIRWSCSPNWSFLSGWSRGDAVMWSKQRFSGDHSFEAFLGVKMEFPRERQIYGERYRDLGVTICGDGSNPRSGYTGVFCATIDSKVQMILYRNGTIVASQPLPQSSIPNQGANHRSWFNLVLNKTGANVEFHVNVGGQPVRGADGKPLMLTYADPDPITEGVPAVWTTDNGISIARIRINFTKKPSPRTEPQIVLDQPWVPEWSNVDPEHPLALDFTNSWSSTGKPVTLDVTARSVPNGEDGVCRTAGTRVFFAPKKAGEYWFQINAKDGVTRSPGFHISTPVFTPALGRDDSHALILYRFNEGKGNIIHDVSAKTPKADLTIIKEEGADAPLTAQWLPDQGLVMRSSSRVMTQSTSGADKLLAMTKTKACTIEMWVSTDTAYPPVSGPYNWTSAFFSWDFYGNTKGNQRNLTIGQTSTNLFVAPRGPFQLNGNIQLNGFRIGLQHFVITWDGTLTRFYCNGTKAAERNIPWPMDLTPGNLFILGNTADSKLPYLGSFYLLAIHDNCFTEEQIKRHYNAGPSAQ